MLIPSHVLVAGCGLYQLQRSSSPRAAKVFVHQAQLTATLHCLLAKCHSRRLPTDIPYRCTLSPVFTCDVVRPLKYSYTMQEPEQEQQAGPNQCHLLLLQDSHSLQGCWLWGMPMESTLTAGETLLISTLSSQALRYNAAYQQAWVGHTSQGSFVAFGLMVSQA